MAIPTYWLGLVLLLLFSVKLKWLPVSGYVPFTEDPLGNLKLKEEDFAWATAELMAVARQGCGGRIVSTLEGGYDLEALAESAAAHVRTLMS